jgi:hypothetical protein
MTECLTRRARRVTWRSGVASTGVALLFRPAVANAAIWQDGFANVARDSTRAASRWDLERLLVWRSDVVLTAVVAMLGALVLAMPIAYVYRHTKRPHAYDPAVPETVLILPAVIAGIVIVVQGSLSLAFSLVGVAATVRFRSNLKDTNDAVFIFFAIALGIAAGVRGLDLALAMSLVFSAIILVVGKSRYSATHLGRGELPIAASADGASLASGTMGRSAMASMPDSLMMEDDRVDVLSPGARDGIITVHATPAQGADGARPAVEARLAEETKRWKLTEVVPGDRGDSIVEYRVRLKKKVDQHALLDDLNTAAQPYGATVEYRSEQVDPSKQGRGE